MGIYYQLYEKTEQVQEGKGRGRHGKLAVFHYAIGRWGYWMVD